MREIKFRAWDKRTKNMSRSYNIQSHPIFDTEHNGEPCIRTIKPSQWLGFDSSSENERQIAMQYTGLKDKNGVEIYESDVVRYLDFCGVDSVTAVEFKDGGFYPFAPDYIHWGNVEVIGNIYENKELLK